MDKVFFEVGDIILYDGLYGCAAGCERQLWGVAGRRLDRLPCHHATWRLLRRRLDQMF